MPRQMRVQYPGAIYHVMSRADRREDIYLDDVDRQDLLKTMTEACQKTCWQVHAYCLRMDGALKPEHSGGLHLETSRNRAERIVAEELSRLGWSEQDLALRPKNAPEKLVMAARLRKETTLTVKEIAARVVLGTSKTANSKLH